MSKNDKAKDREARERELQEKEAENRKKVVLSILAVLVLVMMVISVTYAVVIYSKDGVKENTIRSGSIKFEYNEVTNGISITDAMPMSDSEGKAIENSSNANVTQGFFDFTVTATLGDSSHVNYEISATDVSPSSEKLDPQYVKVYLTDATNDMPVEGYTKDVPVYSNLERATGKPTNKRLYNDTFRGSGTRKYRLRLWVADNYPVLERGNETFSMKVNVEATL